MRGNAKAKHSQLHSNKSPHKKSHTVTNKSPRKRCIHNPCGGRRKA